jgi:hypothetical protein
VPQILIDTDVMTAAEIGATVNFLDDLLTIRRAKDDKAPAPTVNETAPPPPAPFTNVEIETDEGGSVTGVTVSTGLPVPPPPPAPLTVADVVSDNDPEIEIDDEGNVKSVTVSTELPVPPPPPPLPYFDEIPAPPGPAVALELDIKGTAWDGRIHAANRAKKIDGTWKNKRGLENKPGNVTPAAITVPPPPVPAAPSIATPSVPPSTAPAALLDFRGLMKKIQEATAANKLTADQVNDALEGCGLKPEEMAQLINNAPLIASVNAAIDACLTT